MKSSLAGTRTAIVGFLLISLVVIGGMAWASYATFELTRINIDEDRRNTIRHAIGKMESHLQGILGAESARPHSDYLSFHAEEDVRRRDGSFLATDSVYTPSELLQKGPPYDWIELYFQVNQDEVWSSPQLPPTLNPFAATSGSDITRVRAALVWLANRISNETLLEAIVNSKSVFDEALDRDESHPSSLVAVAGRAEPSPAQAGVDYQQRRQSYRDSQRRYVPSPQCAPSDIVEGNLANAERWTDWKLDPVCPPDTTLQVSGFSDPIWIQPDHDGEPRKLVWVRTFQKDADILYQGILADWNRLKQELLGRVTALPGADLEPILGVPEVHDSNGETRLSNIDARLIPPPSPVPSATAAWKKVRWWLMPSWAATVAVLVAAGWGIRNLVSLAGRRLQFAYAVTHELRTPLTTFRLYSDMLAAGLVPEASRQEYVDTLNRESQRLATLVEDVLEYARIENHKVRLSPIPINGYLLGERLTEQLQNRCRLNGLTGVMKNNLAKDRMFQMDVDLVNQIAAVLVDNACRHTRGIENPAVMLDLNSTNGKFHLDVIDTGPGVDRADARTIFLPFRRGRNANERAQGGIGLGLALARSWASLLGGKLELAARNHSQFGGAHFRLTVPSTMKA